MKRVQVKGFCISPFQQRLCRDIKRFMARKGKDSLEEAVGPIGVPSAHGLAGHGPRLPIWMKVHSRQSHLPTQICRIQPVPGKNGSWQSRGCLRKGMRICIPFF
jgi:hypothetical protein